MFDELLKRMVIENLEKSANEECKITLIKRKNRLIHIDVEGSSKAILLNLAGLEKQILNKLDISESMFNSIKKVVGTKEADTIE